MKTTSIDEGASKLTRLPLISISPRLALGLLLLAFLSAFQLLVTQGIPHTPNEDLARHVAHVVNFRSSLAEGQFIPRMQPGGTDIIPDVPVFQYYGFLSSLFALPGLFVGLPPLHALIAGVVIIRWLAVIAIYLTCRILNLTRQAGLMAAVAWLSFPYIQSNLYGRVAIPEASAQAVLAFLPLSWALAVHAETKRIAVLTVAITLLMLALAHPIFLMWSVFAIGLMLVYAVFLQKKNTAKILLIGLLVGICISSFQWLPAILSAKDFQINFFGDSPFSTSSLTSLSGFTGWPKPLITEGGVYYFTISSWIYLGLVGAFLHFFKKENARTDIVLYLFLILVFGFFAYSPLDIWQILPKATWATQFPYRLLSFVAIFSVVILAYACDALFLVEKWNNSILLASIIIFLSGPSLITPYATRPRLSKSLNISAVFASRYYIVTTGRKPAAAGEDGWLIKDNAISIPHSESGSIICLNARSGLLSGSNVGLMVLNATTKQPILNKKIDIPTSGIATGIAIPPGVDLISLVPDNFFVPANIDPLSTDKRELSLLVASLYIDSSAKQLVLPAEIKREIISPYQREFSFNNATVLSQLQYIAELPLAYSRFQIISQGGNNLVSEPSYSGLTRVEISDLRTPLISTYKLPMAAVFLTCGGLLFLFFFLFPIRP